MEASITHEYVISGKHKHIYAKIPFISQVFWRLIIFTLNDVTHSY